MPNLSINTRELIDALSPQDFIMFLSNMRGDGSGSLIRFTGTISKNATADEVRRFMERNLKLREGALNNWQPPLKGTGIIEEDFRKVMALIKPQQDLYLKAGNVTEDKFEELLQVGKFAVHINGNVQLETYDPPLDFPDFIFRIDGKRIGIEHTRLIDGKANAIYKRIKDCLVKTELILKERYPKATGIFNLSISDYVPAINEKSFSDQLTKEERITISETMANYLSSIIDPSIQVIRPSYIQDAFLSSNPGIPIGITLAQSYLPEKNKETAALIMERIEGKEHHYGVSAASAGLAELWLLVVVDGVKSSSGFKLNDSVLPILEKSRFDKIYLFDSFAYEDYLVFQRQAQ